VAHGETGAGCDGRRQGGGRRVVQRAAQKREASLPGNATEWTVIATGVVLWFAQGWYLNEKLRLLHDKFDRVFEQFNGLREYLYEIDPQFDDERSILEETAEDNPMSFAPMRALELAKEKKEAGRRTLNTPF
jgi:hypothetical protein